MSTNGNWPVASNPCSCIFQQYYIGMRGSKIMAPNSSQNLLALLYVTWHGICAGLQGASLQHGAAARLRGCMIRVHVEWLSHQQATKRESTLEPKWRKIRTSWLGFWLFLSTNCANNLTLHLWKATRSQLKQATRAESSGTWAPPTSLAGGTRRHHLIYVHLILCYEF